MFEARLNQHTALPGKILPGNILFGASLRGVSPCAEPEQMLLGSFNYDPCYSIQHILLTMKPWG